MQRSASSLLRCDTPNFRRPHPVKSHTATHLKNYISFSTKHSYRYFMKARNKGFKMKHHGANQRSLAAELSQWDISNWSTLPTPPVSKAQPLLGSYVGLKTSPE